VGDATDYNRAYYGDLSAGRENYWQLMPAPRMRIAHIASVIAGQYPGLTSACDFGCGNGGLLREISARFPHARLFGLDLSQEQINENSRRLPGCLWAQQDLTATNYVYPFGAPCDVAISSEVIEHLDRPDQYLRNMKSSLKEGGLLVLTTQSGQVHATERHVGHVRHWEPEEMRSALEVEGFRDPRVYNCGWPFHDWSKRAANLRPEQTINRFGRAEWGTFERLTAAILRLLFQFNSSSRGYQLVAFARG
jgi:SAM-dependent methyltransferase